jgi:hypothetical protein
MSSIEEGYCWPLTPRQRREIDEKHAAKSAAAPQSSTPESAGETSAMLTVPRSTLRTALDELQSLTIDEKCDHPVGICYCPTYRIIDELQAVLSSPQPATTVQGQKELFEALEQALAEEGHFYQTTMEDGYCVKLMRGPRFCAASVEELLTQLAQHYAPSVPSGNEERRAAMGETENALRSALQSAVARLNEWGPGAADALWIRDIALPLLRGKKPASPASEPTGGAND